MIGTVAVASAVFAGCADIPEQPLPSEAHQAIIGGFDNPGDPAVVAVFTGGLCTGTLVRPNVVITAAHCVIDDNNQVIPAGGSVRFGPGGSAGYFATRSIVSIKIHRAFGAFQSKDIALLRLSEPAPDSVEPIAINTTALDQSWVGIQVRVVGFGNDVPPTGGDPNTGQGAGTKRQTNILVTGVTAEHILYGNQDNNTCQGDSGGPTFADTDNDGIEELIAVTSYGTDNCLGQSNVSRVDAYLDDFILPILSAWHGPCSRDGVRSCDNGVVCEWADPDCDICGLDGLCSPSDCETVDFDCPVGAQIGEFCGDKYDCESRKCVDAPDAPDAKYCSVECDPSDTTVGVCPSPVEVCIQSANDGNHCAFVGITPGTQGALCDASADCLSGICDGNNEICVSLCDSGDDCADEFQCRSISGTKVCTIPEEGGCRTSGGRGVGFGACILFALVAMSRRRRRLP